MIVYIKYHTHSASLHVMHHFDCSNLLTTFININSDSIILLYKIMHHANYCTLLHSITRLIVEYSINFYNLWGMYLLFQFPWNADIPFPCRHIILCNCHDHKLFLLLCYFIPNPYLSLHRHELATTAAKLELTRYKQSAHKLVRQIHHCQNIQLV